MEYNHYEIGYQIMAKRRSKGLSQDDLIEKLNEKTGKRISRNTLSRIENGDPSAYHTLRFDTLAAFCDILGCDMGYLVGEYTDETWELSNTCKSTGYNANVIEFITNLPADQKMILSEILLHKSFLEILNRISEMQTDTFAEMQNDVLGIYIKQKIFHGLAEKKAPISNSISLADCELFIINKYFSDIVSDITEPIGH